METRPGAGSHHVARNLRRVREERGLRATDLARVLGWSKATLSKLEAGDRKISVDDLLALAVALHVAPAYLLVPWEAEDGSLSVELARYELRLDEKQAPAWVVGELAPMPWTDPKDYYWTVPPSQQERTNAILKRMEAAGLVKFIDKDTVQFGSGIVRTTRPEGE